MLEEDIHKTFQVSSVDITQIVKTKFKEEISDESKFKQDTEKHKEKFVWTGTSSHNFIEVDRNHYSQFENLTFLQSHREIYLIQVSV